MSIVDRIRQLSKDKGLSLTVLEQNLGFGNGSIGKWNKQSPSCERISLVADYLGTSVDYLISGKEKNSSTDLTADEQELLTYYKSLDEFNKGKVFGKAELLAEIKKEPKNIIKTVLKQPKTVELIEPDQVDDEDNYTYIDLYDMPASAGTGVYLSGNACEPLKVRCNSLTAEANFAVEVRGGSMEPKFYDGDIVLIRTQPCVEIGEVGIFIINEEGYIKEFGGDKLISINSKYNDVILHDYDSFYCKGKVLGVLENDDILE